MKLTFNEGHMALAAYFLLRLIFLSQLIWILILAVTQKQNI